jgi:hypothetical protein
MSVEDVDESLRHAQACAEWCAAVTGSYKPRCASPGSWGAVAYVVLWVTVFLLLFKPAVQRFVSIATDILCATGTVAHARCTGCCLDSTACHIVSPLVDAAASWHEALI